MSLRHHNAKVLLCEDFNELDGTDIASHFCLTQVVDLTTHCHNTLNLSISDMTDWYLPPLPPKHLLSLRPTPDSAVRRFGQWVVGYRWIEILTVENVEDKRNSYFAIICQAYHNFYSTKTTRTQAAILPWVTPRIKHLM